MPKRVMRNCGYCGGTGEVKELVTLRRCPVCGGNGEVSVGSDYIRCRLCNGSGKRVGVLQIEPCDNFRGRGWAPLREY